MGTSNYFVLPQLTDGDTLKQLEGKKRNHTKCLTEVDITAAPPIARVSNLGLKNWV